MAQGWILGKSSALVQSILAKVIFLISLSCCGVKDAVCWPFSYQKRSPRLKFKNWRAIMQAIVGPTAAPGSFFSDTPADQRSISSTCL